MTKLLKNYIKETKEQIKLLRPDIDDKELENFIKSKVKENYKNPTCEFQDKNMECEQGSLMRVIDFIEKDKPIISGYGAFFKQHGELKSVEYDLITYLGDTRSIYKKKKIEHTNDEDKRLYNIYDIFQLTFKLLANSLFGIYTEGNSFFYHPLIGPSITQTGQVIISTCLNLFEKTLSGNMLFRKIHDVTRYVNNILKEDYDIEDYVNKEKFVSKNTVFKFFKDRCIFRDNESVSLLKNLINHLSKKDCNKLFFKNNLYQLIERCNDFKESLLSILGEDKLLDPNEPPKEYIPALEKMWNIFNICCHYNYMDFYRMENANYKKRKVVLTVDTDSNLIYLYPFFEFSKRLMEDNNRELKDDNDNRFITCNILMYLNTKLVANCFDKLTTLMGIRDPEQRKLIKMKNEFYISRMLLTNGKKNYSYILNANEGKILEKPKHEIKGLAIKKVDTNRKVREYYTNMLSKYILLPREIDVPKVFNKYLEFHEIIRQNITSGDTTYLLPGKVNEIESYAFPLRQLTVRGSLLWNSIYEDKVIVYPDKINYMKLSIKTLDKSEYPYTAICRILDNMDNIKDNFREHLKEKIYEQCYSTDELAHYGMNVICFPKSITKVPNWIIPFINVDQMVETNLKPGYKILNSLNSKILSYQVGDDKGEKLSNIVTI